MSATFRGSPRHMQNATPVADDADPYLGQDEGGRTVPEGFLYFSAFLSPSEIDQYMKWVVSLTFEHQKFRGQMMKRGQAMFGYEYRANFRNVQQAAPFPTILQDLAGRVKSLCPSEVCFNQCIITEYPPGAGIGWHTDARVFSDCIAGLSLGAPADFLLQKGPNPGDRFHVHASAGSLYVMTGVVRWHYQHCVKPVRATRYSLTFRCVETLAG